MPNNKKVVLSMLFFALCALVAAYKILSKTTAPIERGEEHPIAGHKIAPMPITNLNNKKVEDTEQTLRPKSTEKTTRPNPTVGAQKEQLAMPILNSKHFHCKVHNFSSYINTQDTKEFECVRTTAIQDLKICLYPTNRDIWVSGNIRKHGAWELDITHRIQSMLKIYPRASFIDIGANIGMHSLVVAKSGRKVLGVEPKWSNLQRLHKSVNLNNLTDNIVVIENGISNERANVTLYSDNRNQGGSSLIFGQVNKETIQTILMDDLLEVFHEKEAVIKIDIEGSESRAFINSTKFFSTVKVHVIFMEWAAMKNKFKKTEAVNNPERILTVNMVAYLRSLGLQPYRISSDIFNLQRQKASLSNTDMANWPNDIVWLRN